MGKAIDHSGQRFGGLLVLHRVEGKLPRPAFLCRCKCGKEKVFPAARLRQEKLTSCNEGPCKKDRALKLKDATPSFQKRCVNDYLRNSRNRGIAWTLSNEQAYELFAQNCFYCGQSPSNRCTLPWSKQTFLYNGIDRVDNAKGYTQDNCVACCGRCNVAKNNMSQTEFLELIRRIAERHL